MQKTASPVHRTLYHSFGARKLHTGRPVMFCKPESARVKFGPW